ncbi:MAG: hypothetical protein PHC61_13620 [Chitinivibrionales bacterium]|nr:hypothetical protein [Chitinivibrionales bacterium]
MVATANVDCKCEIDDILSHSTIEIARKLALSFSNVQNIEVPKTIAIVKPNQMDNLSSQIVNFSPDFTVTYDNIWAIARSKKDMGNSMRDLADQLEGIGARLVYSGHTTDDRCGTRAIVINKNLSNENYAEEIRKLNKKTITNDMGFTDISTDHFQMLKWVYDGGGGQYRFAEYFIRLGTYNIRIAFWTERGSFDGFKDTFESTIRTFKQN